MSEKGSKKFAVISECLPLSASGLGTFLHRMLEGLGPDDYCLLSPETHDPQATWGETARDSPRNYYHLSKGFQFIRGFRFGLNNLREGVNVPLAVIQQGIRIAGILKRERCAAVVAFTGEMTHLPSAYLASRMVGIPFFAYICDHYSYREWYSPAASFWSKRFEPLIVKGAARLIVLNEFLQQDYRRRFGVEATVVHNALDLSPYQRAPRELPAAPPAEFKIVYTGDIYEAHYDAFRNIVSAIELLGAPNIKLHLYTPRSPAELAEKQIRGPVVVHRPLPVAEMPRVQQEADMLFIPLAFESPFPKLVKTSAPTKLGEYLAAGRPVLVHAPADSFLSSYFNEHRCGIVVDQCDPRAVAEAIKKVLDDQELRRQLCARAWARAQSDFDIQVERPVFLDLLQRRNGNRSKN